MRLKMLLMSGVIGLGGCTSMPTASELANADYGQHMYQSECEGLARDILSNSLKDPYSAQYSFGSCQTMGGNSVPLLGVPKQFGYGMTVQVNAKNSFGGYTGDVTYIFIFKNGQVIRRGREDKDLGTILPF